MKCELIHNFRKVGAGVYRGGQPFSNGSWYFLYELGVEKIIKLNTEPENEPPGFTVLQCPVSLGQQVGFAPIPPTYFDSFLFAEPHFFVHCEHGQDRTGLFVAMYRVRVQGWTKVRAQQEMLKFGFHKFLHGLWEYWEKFEG
jgi:tyrosine-protein phosphatase SIW14